MSASIDVKRLRHLADVVEAVQTADKKTLSLDAPDAQEEQLSFKVTVKWYAEPFCTIEDVTGDGDYMVMFP